MWTPLLVTSISLLSYFTTIVIRKRKLFKVDGENPLENKRIKIIKKILSAVIVFCLIYYVFICFVLGWEPYQFYLAHLIVLPVLLIFDWLLIAYIFPKDNQRLFGIKMYWLAFSYRFVRTTYFIGSICILIVSFFVGIYLFLYVLVGIVTFTPDMAIERLRIITFGDKTKSYDYITRGNIFFRQSEAGSLQFESGNKRMLKGERYVIVQSDDMKSYFHIYRSEFFLFRKYLYTVEASIYDVKDKPVRLSSNRDTLFIGDPKVPYNFIVLNDNEVIHTIIRKDRISNLNSSGNIGDNKTHYKAERIDISKF